jgi:hypothetical protein
MANTLNKGASLTITTPRTLATLSQRQRGNVLIWLAKRALAERATLRALA